MISIIVVIIHYRAVTPILTILKFSFKISYPYNYRIKRANYSTVLLPGSTHWSCYLCVLYKVD